MPLPSIHQIPVLTNDNLRDSTLYHLKKIKTSFWHVLPEKKPRSSEFIGAAIERYHSVIETFEMEKKIDHDIIEQMLPLIPHLIFPTIRWLFLQKPEYKQWITDIEISFKEFDYLKDNKLLLFESTEDMVLYRLKWL